MKLAESGVTESLAERVGFEPTEPFRVHALSRRVPSATRPSLRRKKRCRLGCVPYERRSASPRCAPTLGGLAVQGWRRGRDSNPRCSFPHAGLANLCLKPLGHLSRASSASLAVWPACGAAQDSGREHGPPGWGVADAGSLSDGGEGGIRTLETLSRLAVFKTAAINHSATSPRDDKLARERAKRDRPKSWRAMVMGQRRGQAAASRARRAAESRAPSASISATGRGRPLPDPQNST